MPKRPRQRTGHSWDWEIQGFSGVLTISEYPDGRPMELFISAMKHGSTLGGLIESIAILVSNMLQHMEVVKVVEALIHIRFEPNGQVSHDPDVKWCQSIPDYFGRKLAMLYLDEKARHDIGVETVGLGQQ